MASLKVTSYHNFFLSIVPVARAFNKARSWQRRLARVSRRARDHFRRLVDRQELPSGRKSGVRITKTIQRPSFPLGPDIALFRRMLAKFDAYKVAKKFYWASKKLRLPRYLYDQYMRACSSVTLNIAEGSGKRTEKDQAHFYSNALGSLRECQAVLEMEKIENEELKALANRLGAMLFKLSKKGNPKQD